MTFNEVRKDYLLDRWVVIATERGRRPTDFKRKINKQKASTTGCPLCPGNEYMTPPAVLVYVKSGRRIRKLKDKDGLRHKNWLIRCIPNLYPAFTPPKDPSSRVSVMKQKNLAAAVGHHEVLVESPNHCEHPANAASSQILLLINAYIDRLRDLSGKSYVKHVSIFRNHGLEAGASLSHAHSQMIATPFIPETIREELGASVKFMSKHGRCIFCEILEKEMKGPRLILQNRTYLAFAPWASVNPLEFWIAPKEHQATLLEMTRPEMKTFAEFMKSCFKGLDRLLSDPPYNFGFHLAPSNGDPKHYHWHLEVYPRLSIWAGFEKSTGIYINTVAPEEAARGLSEAIQ